MCVMTVGEVISDGLENNDADCPDTSDHASGCYFSGHSHWESLGSEHFLFLNFLQIDEQLQLS